VSSLFRRLVYLDILCRSRILTCCSSHRPHILLLDEPTNSLDPESIDALAKAVNEFEGGMVLVSHDMRLISQVAKEIWICDNKTITPYKGDIASFKLDMRKQMGLEDGKQAPKTLRGDASVKVKEGEQAKPKPVPPPKQKLEVVAPPPKAKPVAPPSVVTPPTAPPAKIAVEDDETTVTSTVTNNSLPLAATAPPSAAPAGNDGAAPAKAKYIPPHLRKKMQEQEQS
jgi:energy-coupling factor transporter ATP-binding protein EcfA2